MDTKIKEFLESKANNTWLEYSWGRVYVRKSQRPMCDIYITMFDIASIEVLPQYRGMGYFTAWLDQVEQQVTMPIFVENIFNGRLYQFLLDRHYTIMSDGPPWSVRTLTNYKPI